ncbi:MAG: histidinol-phosphatase [Duncaniella sp.]|nr:histidinol-phosphatase [Duncaniella sp.]
MSTVRDIIASTTRYNLHSHTQFCDGRADMASMAAQAVAEGFEHYGFSPHSPIPPAVHSTCNMRADSVDNYIAEFLRLRSLYSGRIALWLSMEIDYLGPSWGASHPYFSALPLDYRISSVHFIPDKSGIETDVDGRPASFIRKMHEQFDDDIRYVVDTFYARTLEMIEAGGFDIIGHFDKIGANASAFMSGIEEQAWYRRHIDNVIDALQGKDIVVEINTKSWLPYPGVTAEEVESHKPRLFPSPDTVRRLASAGIPMAVNSDAHYPDRLNAGRREAYSLFSFMIP